MQLKANTQVGLHTGLEEAMLYVKQERILGVSPPASSVSSISSQMHPAGLESWRRSTLIFWGYEWHLPGM
jgi:hypothetical protein